MKRSISFLTAVVIAGAVVAPAHGAPKPSIEDPAGDANFANDQGTGDGSVGDVAGPADASDFADLLSVTFTNTKKDLQVHIETADTATPTAGEGFRVRTNPEGAGGTSCFLFEIFFPGAQNDMTAPKAHVLDYCSGGTVETIEAEATYSPLGGFMIVVPRKAHDGFGKGAKITAPQAQSFIWSGSYPTGVPGPYLDTTKPGSDYALKK